MKLFVRTIGIILTIFCLYVILVLGIQFFYMLEKSPVKKIIPKLNPNSAILVIDVQNKLTFYDDPQKAKKYQVTQFLNNINLALNKLNGYEVIYIRQEFAKNSVLSFILPMYPEEEEPGTAINKNIFRENARIFTKTQADAFSNPELQKYLNSKKTGTLYITGLAAEVCVNSTIKSAIANGYRVYVIKDAVLSIRGGSPDMKRLDKYRSSGAEIISVNDLK